MSRNSTPFVITLGVRDAETVERALRSLGAEGERALNQLQRAAARDELRQRFRPAVEEARASVEGLTGSLGPAGTALSGLGAGGIAAAAGFAVLSAGVARGVREFAEAEVSIKRLEGVVRATGGAAGRTAEDIGKLAERMAQTRLVTPEQVQDASSVLLTFRSVVGETFDEAIGLAQDLSAVFGGDLRSSATLLGKALESPTEGLSALRRVGITFTASQQEVIRTLEETGRKAEAQRAILEGVARQVGGAGAAEGDSLRGAFHRATEAAGNFFEALARGTGAAYVVRVALESSASGLNGTADAINGVRTPLDVQADVVAGLERQIAVVEGRRAPRRGTTNTRQQVQSLQSEDYAAMLDQLDAARGEFSVLNQEVSDREAMRANAVRERADVAAEEQRLEQLATRKRVLDELATSQQREIELSRLSASASAVAAAGDRAVAEAKRVARDAQVALTDAELEEIRQRAEGVESAKQLRKETEDLTRTRIEGLDAVDQQAAGLMAEADGLKLTARERAVANEVLKAENTLRRAKIDLDSEEARARIEQVRQGAEARFDADTIQSATRAVQERQTRDQERLRTEAERQWGRMFDRVTDYGADALFDAFQGRISSVGEFLRVTLLRASAQGLAEIGIRPLLMSGASALGLTAGGGGGTGVSVGGFGFGSFGSLQSSLFGQAAQYNIADTLLSPATSGILGQGGTLFGSQFAADAFLPGVGAVLPGLLSGNGRQAAFGGGGALAGAAIGSIIPGVGTAIGAAVGGALGNLLGGGAGGRGDPYVQSSLTLQNGQLVGVAAGDNDADPTAARQRAQQLAAVVNALSGTYGVTIGAGSGLYGDRTGLSEDAALANVVRGLGGGSTQRVRDALSASRATGDLQQVTAALQAADALDRMADAAELAAGRTIDYAAVLRRATEQERVQATRSASATIVSLADYARSLQVGERSPLSAQDQLLAATRQFDAVAGGARVGDANSLQRFTGVADTFLQATRAVDGSGAGYAAAVERVSSALTDIGGLTGDQLTATFYAAQVAAQTGTIAQGLETVRQEVQNLRDQLRGLSVAPARLAA
jgi:hypothetical protein